MTSPTALVEVLERARRLGVLGPGPVEAHVAHGQAFVRALQDLPEGALVIDLGSGAGVPGLVVASARPDLRMALLDAAERRAALLTEAVAALDLGARVTVLHERAEVVGRDPSWRQQAAAVTARSFGPPAVTAECAAPLLRGDGRLVVSEPPDGGDRWPSEGLRPLGLRPEPPLGDVVRVLRQAEPCPDRYPRRVGVPTKRPLF